MELIEVILSKENLNRAYKKVVSHKDTGGVAGVTVEELGEHIRENKDTIVASIRNRTYMSIVRLNLNKLGVGNILTYMEL